MSLAVAQRFAAVQAEGPISTAGIAALSFIAGASLVLVYIKKFKNQVKVKIEQPEIAEPIKKIFVATSGQRFHVKENCPGLDSARVKISKTPCLRCCPEGVICV